VESDRLLKETKAVLVVDLMDYIRELIEKYEHIFKEPEPGVYLVGEATPILKSTEFYYSESSFKTQTFITSLDGLEEAILDEDGATIIPTYIMRRKARMLSNKPTLPVRAIQIAFETIQDQIDEMLPHTPAREYGAAVKEHVQSEFHSIVSDGYIEASLTKLIHEVTMFVGCDVWNLYYFKLQKTNLIIEKGVDYRIFAWTLNQEQEASIDQDE
jgi:hypothetical protein